MPTASEVYRERPDRSHPLLRSRARRPVPCGRAIPVKLRRPDPALATRQGVEGRAEGGAQSDEAVRRTTLGVENSGKPEQGKSVSLRCPRASEETNFPAAKASPPCSSPAQPLHPSRYAVRSPFSESPGGPTHDRGAHGRDRGGPRVGAVERILPRSALGHRRPVRARGGRKPFPCAEGRRVPDWTAPPPSRPMSCRFPDRARRRGASTHRPQPRRDARHQIGADGVRFVAACLDWLASHSSAEARIQPPTWMLQRHPALVTNSPNKRTSRQPSTINEAVTEIRGPGVRSCPRCPGPGSAVSSLPNAAKARGATR